MAEAAIKVWCRACNKKLGFPVSAVGRKAKCPACGLVFVVEAQAERAASKSAKLLGIKDDLLRVECPSCSKVSKFKPAAAGKKARCSACDEVYYVPQLPADSGAADQAANQGTAADLAAQTDTAPARSQPTATGSYSSAAALVEDEPPASESDGLYDVLADAERSAENAESQEEMIARMQAAAATKSAASDYRSSVSEGKRIAAESEPSLIQKVLDAVGPLGKGITFSCVGAVIGAFIWFGIARATEYEIGYVAWGVGLLAGLGMHMGVRAESGLAGALAALIAFGGILGGKLLVVMWVLFPLISAEAAKDAKALENDIEMQREEMVEIKTEEILKQRGLNPERISDEQAGQIEEEAMKKVDAMKDADVRAQHKAWKAAHPEPERSKPDLDKVPTSVIVIFVAVLFGIHGIFFSILAMATAYKVGRSGLSFSRD